MKHTVTQAFATPLRRFSVGQEVSPDDISGPVSFADWIKLGYIAPPPAPKPPKAAPPAE